MLSDYDRIITIAVKKWNSVQQVFWQCIASPKFAFCEILWSYFKYLDLCLDIPEILVGDWNQVLLSSKKQKGSVC